MIAILYWNRHIKNGVYM